MSNKYELIDAEYAHHLAPAPTIGQMCHWLEVSRSGFYEWRSRPLSATAARRDLLKLKITALFEASDRTYGYRRIHAELLRGGEQVGDELVRRLMRELGLVACQPRPYKTTTIADQQPAPIPDLVRRDFTADTPGSKLVGDITYIATWQGWLYLATVIDCFNREVIGYAMADHMRTSLVTDAVSMAARNHILVSGCVFHSDRGSQYTSAEFAAVLDQSGYAWLGRSDRDLLRQRAGRIIQFRAQSRTCPPHRLPDAEEGSRRHCTLHRDLLQSSTNPLRAGLSNPARSPQQSPEDPSRSIITGNSVARKSRGRLSAGQTSWCREPTAAAEVEAHRHLKNHDDAHGEKNESDDVQAEPPAENASQATPKAIPAVQRRARPLSSALRGGPVPSVEGQIGRFR